ncbi:TPA: helix-turn-helix transcriptional regulator [Enterobacter kobei]|nr:helix-turn-helix transcriptional regulator [Enterobacter kobei]
MNNIAKQRKEIGVSQAALASAIGWGQSRIANYELNIRTPSLPHAGQSRRSVAGKRRPGFCR